jgi:hypothetical protein
MPMKRSRSTQSFAARAKRARMNFRTTRGVRSLLSRGLPPKFGGRLFTPYRTLAQRVNTLYRTIETKEFTWRTSPNVALPHNNVTVVQQQSGGDLNIFRSANSTDDPMGVGGSRIGDKITVKGIMIKGFFENALSRPKVYYRVMLLRGAKGETFSRANIFKSNTDNKMIDQVNTERFSIVAQKIFNVSASNNIASSVSLTGVPGSLNATEHVGVATKTFKMWIPGYKFGRDGVVNYENGSTGQIKFYDYRLCIVVYDWYGTPQDVNNVGRINELYSKLYMKDA